MSRALPITLHSAVVPPERTSSRFEASARSGKINLRGNLSVGSRGWKLWARATSFRSTITVQVVASETGRPGGPDIEHHQYRATIEVPRSGRYYVRVAHVYQPHAATGHGLPAPVFESVLVVPEFLEPGG